MEERSTFFVELPEASSVREHGLVLLRSGLGLISRAAARLGSALAEAVSPSASAESLWHDVRDKWRAWLLGVGIAVVVLLLLSFLSASFISARYPHTQQQLHLHLHHGGPSHSGPSQNSGVQKDSQETIFPAENAHKIVPLTLPPHLPSSSHKNASNAQNHQQSGQLQVSGTQPRPSDSQREMGDQGVGHPDSKNSLLSVALETEALQLPGSATRAELQASGREQQQQVVQRQKLLSPTVQLEQGLILISQIPERPRAVLLLLHGCGKGPGLFWPQHPNCTHCVGLPEEQAVLVGALRRGYAVLGIRHQKSSCWEASSSDVALVSSIVSSWRTTKGLDTLPLYAWGFSSGGTFATVLAHAIKFKALAIYLSGGQPRALSSSKSLNSTFPPCIFVHMPRDVRTAKSVTAAVQGLGRIGVPAAQLRCRPLPVSPLFFSDRIPSFPVVLSQEIFGALKIHGFLDKDGFVVDNPRASKWEDVLERDGILARLGARDKRVLEDRAAVDQRRVSTTQHHLLMNHAGATLKRRGSHMLNSRGNIDNEGQISRGSKDNEGLMTRGQNPRGRRTQAGEGSEVAFGMEQDPQWQRSSIAEELNLAYGLHEFTSNKATETFDWFNDRCWFNGRYRHHRCSRYYASRSSSAM